MGQYGSKKMSDVGQNSVKKCPVTHGDWRSGLKVKVFAGR